MEKLGSEGASGEHNEYQGIGKDENLGKGAQNYEVA